MKNNYRKIYEQHHGPIPKDINGRKYEVHHIDGNHYNNSPNNLVALTIEEHYDVHYRQEDWYACFLIGLRMKKSPEELSSLLSGENNHNFDSTIYHLVHKTGKMFTGTRREFLKANKTISDSGLSLMISGRSLTVMGWKPIDRLIKKQQPRTGFADLTLYKFAHDSGTLFIGNRRDFIKVHGQNQGKVSQLINGKIPHTNNWRLLHD